MIATDLLTRDQLRAQLDEMARARYHHLHPFQLRMNAGELSPDEIRDWVLNRFYYQRTMPVKDAIVVSKLPGPQERRVWLQRIVEQDGSEDDPGGLELWLRLGDAVGLERSAMLDVSRLAPGARFAVDAYVNFCRKSSWQECVAASLTQIYAGDTIDERRSAFERHYRWIEPEGLEYFRRHGDHARRVSAAALDLLYAGLESRAAQEAAIAAFQLKCDVLWSLLDAIDAIR